MMYRRDRFIEAHSLIEKAKLFSDKTIDFLQQLILKLFLYLYLDF